jgi:hypothetical protein
LGKELDLEDPEQWLEDCPDRVFENWVAAYRLRPFGDEQALLARAVSLLFLIASRGQQFEQVYKASDSIMKLLMPEDWIGNAKEKATIPTVDIENLKAMNKVISKAFG